VLKKFATFLLIVKRLRSVVDAIGKEWVEIGLWPLRTKSRKGGSRGARNDSRG